MFVNAVEDFLTYTLYCMERLEKAKEIMATIIKESDIE